MTKTHKHRAKIANDSARPPKSSPNDYGNNPYITGEIRGVVYEVPDDFYELEKKYRKRMLKTCVENDL